MGTNSEYQTNQLSIKKEQENIAKQRALKIALKNVKKCLLNGSKEVKITRINGGGYLVLSKIKEQNGSDEE